MTRFTTSTRRRGPGRGGLPAPLLTAALLVGVLAGPQGFAGTTIYRTVDEHGNVVFTDVPPKPGEPGKAVKLNQENSFTPPERSTGAARTVDEWRREQQGGEDADGSKQSTGYESVSILAPANDAAIRDNAGNVTVTGEVKPPLRPGDAVQVYLDGQLMQSATSPSVQLNNVDRGTHAVQLRIVNGAGSTVATSQSVTFHLLRHSVLQPSPP